MTFKNSNLLDVAAQFLSTIIGRGCYLALQIFLAHDLGPQGFGVYAIGWSLTGLVGTVAPFGMPQAVLRFNVGGRRALLAPPMRVALLSGVTLVAVLLVTAEPIARVFFSEPAAGSAILALAPSVLLFSLFQVLTSALRASHHNVASAALNALLFILYFITTFLAFIVGGEHTPAVAGHSYTVAIVLTLLPTVWMLRRLPSSPVMPRLQPLLRFGFITLLVHSASVMNLWADRLLLGVMADARSVGIYQVASQLAMVGQVLRVAVISVFEARVPKRQGNSNLVQDVTRDFVAATRILLHVSVPGLICLAMTSQYWTGALFGADYGEAATPLAVLAAGQLVQSFTGPATTALHMTGKEHAVMRLTIGTCLLNVVGNVILIPVLGLTGSAIASGIANIMLGAGSTWMLLRTGRLRLFLSPINDIVLATLVCTATAGLAMFYIGAHSLIAVLIQLLFVCLAYFLVVAFFRHVEDEAFDLLQRLLRRALRVQPAPQLPAP